MADAIARAILGQVKRQKGCRVRDMYSVLPDAYRYTDSDPMDFLVEPLMKLLNWNLIQAWKQGEMLKVRTSEDLDVGPRLHLLTFYLSPVAAMMEDALNLDFSGRPYSIFGDPIESSEWPDLFVLMPFDTELKPIFDDHIKPAAERAGISCARADDFFSSESVVREIWSAIVYAKIVLADCTNRNPNVFYEIGIAHTLGKETILISQSIDDVPFDLRHLRIIKYDYTPRGMVTFEKQLAATLGSPRLDQELGRGE